jgi:hypothetical protein
MLELWQRSLFNSLTQSWVPLPSANAMVDTERQKTNIFEDLQNKGDECLNIHHPYFNNNLAQSYFRAGLPPNYLRRRCVSPLSSRWMSVVPHRHMHQEYCLDFMQLDGSTNLHFKA